MAAHTHVAADQARVMSAANGSTGRRILVVDDHEIVRRGLRLVLANHGWVARCLGAANGAEAVDLTRRYSPHVALVDILLGEELGVEVCKALLREKPELRVILMSGSADVSQTVALAAGARGFLPKAWSSDAIAAAVRRVGDGGTIFHRPEVATPARRLSQRELDVLQQIVSGLSNREAGAALHLSRHTVKQHTSSVYRKLGVRNRAEAASRARLLGLVE